MQWVARNFISVSVAKQNDDAIRGEPILVIRHGRRPQEFRLEMAGDQLLVNGKPYDITENTLCQ